MAAHHDHDPSITHKSFSRPDDEMDYDHGQAAAISLRGEPVWRSELAPGWSWDTDVKPYTDGLEACPMTHREFVVSGRIRYHMPDGSEVEASAGDLLFIPPGHRGWVVGDETCVLVDW
jgi:hypothetical protein